MIKTIKVICCDQCGAEGVEADGFVEAYAVAVKAGTVYTNDLCPKDKAKVDAWSEDYIAKAPQKPKAKAVRKGRGKDLTPAQLEVHVKAWHWASTKVDGQYPMGYQRRPLGKAPGPVTATVLQGYLDSHPGTSYPQAA